MIFPDYKSEIENCSRQLKHYTTILEGLEMMVTPLKNSCNQLPDGYDKGKAMIELAETEMSILVKKDLIQRYEQRKVEHQVKLGKLTEEMKKNWDELLAKANGMKQHKREVAAVLSTMSGGDIDDASKLSIYQALKHYTQFTARA